MSEDKVGALLNSSALRTGNILANAISVDEFFISEKCMCRNKTDSLQHVAGSAF